MSMQTLRSLVNDLPDFTSSFKQNCALTKYVDITLAWTLRRLPQMTSVTDMRLMPWGYRSRSGNSTNVTADFIADVRDGAVASIHYYGGHTLFPKYYGGDTLFHMLFSKKISQKQKMHDLHVLVAEGMQV